METRTINQESEADWEELTPALEDAMNSLGSKQRETIVLRYFERQELHQVAETLG